MSEKEKTDRPPVPRRSHSVKILRNYSAPETGLKVVNVDLNEDPAKYRLAKPKDKRLKSRRSLDAMEKQAGELLDFLSELENKKASCNDNEFLTFLTDSQSSDQKLIEEKSNEDKSSGKKFPVRRVSVRDRAKLFLKPDIKEEPSESGAKLDGNSNHIAKSFSGLSLAPALVSCNNNNNNNNNNSNNNNSNKNCYSSALSKGCDPPYEISCGSDPLFSVPCSEIHKSDDVFCFPDDRNIPCS